MKLYELYDPVDLSCARVALVGEPGYKKCEACGYIIEYPKPLKRVVEWLEGSDRICSFVWPARLVAEVLVVEAVRRVMEGKGVEFIPVEFYQDPKLKQPKRMTKRTKPRVWLPYQGPPLWDLWISTWVHADRERSSLRMRSRCPVCGHEVYEVEGIEELTHRYDLQQKKLIEIHVPREAGKGIFVHRSDLPNGVELFRVHEQPGRILCTERIKDELERHGFENVLYLEVGEIIA